METCYAGLMTHALLHYSFDHFTLPPEPSSGEQGSRRKKENRPLPPEARWLLWQWSREIGLQQGIACRVEVLCQHLGTTQQHWRRIREMLESSGVMVPRRIPKNRGRPLTAYRISDKLRYDLESLPITGNNHHRKIEHVLGREGPTTSSSRGESSKVGNANLLLAAKRKGRLTPSNRWLIAVLLALAEPSGRMSGASYSRLGKLSGMSRNQLQSQLAKLHDHGVLAYVQPGRLGNFCGSKMTSTFVFDFDHPVFGPNPSVEVEVTLFSPRRSRSSRTVVTALAEAMFVVACYQAEVEEKGGQEAGRESAEKDKVVIEDALALLPKAFGVGPLAKDLASAYDAHSANWLLARLHGYAELLLTAGWDKLSRGEGGIGDPVDEVLDAIARDFPHCGGAADRVEHPEETSDVSKTGRGSTDAESSTGLGIDAAYAPHLALFYSLAHHLATQLQPWVELTGQQREDLCLRDMHFSLVPGAKHDLSYLKVRGYSQSGPAEGMPAKTFVTLQSIKSDLGEWLHRRFGPDVPSLAAPTPTK